MNSPSHGIFSAKHSEAWEGEESSPRSDCKRAGVNGGEQEGAVGRRPVRSCCLSLRTQTKDSRRSDERLSVMVSRPTSIPVLGSGPSTAIFFHNVINFQVSRPLCHFPSDSRAADRKWQTWDSGWSLRNVGLSPETSDGWIPGMSLPSVEGRLWAPGWRLIVNMKIGQPPPGSNLHYTSPPLSRFKPNYIFRFEPRRER